MYKNYTKSILLLTSLALIYTSCRKDRGTVIYSSEISATKGIYVLCEGAFGGTGSTITYYDIVTNTSNADYYKKINGTDLGFNANDLKAYGSKMYCVITGKGSGNTAFVDVMNIATGKSLKRLSLGSVELRNVAFANGKAYVSAYNGKIIRIDTATMNVDGELQLFNGAAPAAYLQGIASANGKLYVAGGSYFLPANTYNNKVVVVELSTFTKQKEITVAANPKTLAVSQAGEIYALTIGEFGGAIGAVNKISSITDEVTATETLQDLGAIAIGKNSAWLTYNIYGAVPLIKSLNLSTGKAGANLITDGTAVATPYGLTINDFDNTVLVADANNYASRGQAFIFTAAGKKKYSFYTGTNPQAAVFNYSYK